MNKSLACRWQSLLLEVPWGKDVSKHLSQQYNQPANQLLTAVRCKPAVYTPLSLLANPTATRRPLWTRLTQNKPSDVGRQQHDRLIVGKNGLNSEKVTPCSGKASGKLDTRSETKPHQ